MQKAKVIIRSFELDKEGKPYTSGDMPKDMTIMSGKLAGICYMPDDYLSNGIQNEESALKRANGNSKNGHHSVYDHATITFELQSNKMMAMILNSLGVYTTSEKSARYTKMQPETELELTLYNKWRAKLQQLILAKYPDMDDEILSKRLCKSMGIENSKAVINGSCAHIKEDEYLEGELNTLKKSETLPSYKLAQENARYMISVFTPTTLAYTISFRQLFLIIDYLDRLSINLQHAQDTFSKKLINSVTELSDAFKDVIGESKLHDTKNQYIRFLEAQHLGEVRGKGDELEFEQFVDMEQRLEPKKSTYGDSYTSVYTASLAMLAQAQRHRTLRYTMKLQEPGEIGFYIPEIIRNTELEDEWAKDIESVAYCIPQGTLVQITEQGLFEDFVLKCKERLCGRAQLEVMKSTTKTLQHFIDNKYNLCYSNKQLLQSMLQYDNEILPRCRFKDYSCTEGCRWGSKDALTRLI